MIAICCEHEARAIVFFERRVSRFAVVLANGEQEMDCYPWHFPASAVPVMGRVRHFL